MGYYLWLFVHTNPTAIFMIVLSVATETPSLWCCTIPGDSPVTVERLQTLKRGFTLGLF